MITVERELKGAEAEVKSLRQELKQANREVVLMALRYNALGKRCKRFKDVIAALVLFILVAVCILGAWWER